MNKYKVISDANMTIKTSWIMINERVQQTCREIMNILKKVKLVFIRIWQTSVCCPRWLY